MKTKLSTYYFLLNKIGFITATVAVIILATIPIQPTHMAGGNDKILHATTFIILTYLLDHGWNHSSMTWLKFCLLNLYGFLIEVLQLTTTYREFSLMDCLANLAGIIIYILICPLLKKIPIINWKWQVIKR